MKKNKLALIVRTDLGMGTGKIVAQTGHAVAQTMIDCERTQEFNDWLNSGMKKVTVGVDSEERLLQAVEKARHHKIPYVLIKDAGLTQVEPGTFTVAAIGPAKDKRIEKVTGSLKLLP